MFDMRRWQFITLLGVAAAWPLAAWGQQGDDRIRALQGRILLLQAEAAAKEIGQHIEGIKSQVGWTTQLPWSAEAIEARRFDALRLLRQVPAITDVAQLDATGKERIRSTRGAVDVIDSGAEFANDPMFVQALAYKIYYGPVYFRRGADPFMKIAVAGTRRDAGVSVADFGLKLVWEVVKEAKVGKSGVAYVVDREGRLIVHPDIDLMLRNTDMSKLAQVRDVLGGKIELVREGEDLKSRKVLTAHARLGSLGWLVFVELPVEEAETFHAQALGQSAQRVGQIDKEAGKFNTEIWKRLIADRLEQMKVYPSDARERKEMGVVQVFFTLNRKGELVSSRIEKSSGHLSLDVASLEIVRKGQPFVPPPAHFTEEEIALTVPIRFHLPD